jgi:hypothetical protein
MGLINQAPTMDFEKNSLNLGYSYLTRYINTVKELKYLEARSDGRLKWG